MADLNPAFHTKRPTDGVLIACCELTGTPHAPGEARQFIRKHLDGHARLEDAVLVISELVTNAVRHSASGAGGTITVVLAEVSGGARIEVIDEGSPGPGPALVPVRPTWELAESGHGLRLVTEVTGGRWGHYRRDDAPARVVWAEICT